MGAIEVAEDMGSDEGKEGGEKEEQYARWEKEKEEDIKNQLRKGY